MARTFTTPAARWADLTRTSNELEARLRAEGRRPYTMPIGGSTALGAAAFVVAWAELLNQLTERGDPAGAVVVSSSTGGTHAGMVAGRTLLGGPRIIAIDVAKKSSDLAADTARLASATLVLAGGGMQIDAAEVNVDTRFVGPDYAVPTPKADAAMLGLARSGGWVLDRVYTARASPAC